MVDVTKLTYIEVGVENFGQHYKHYSTIAVSNIYDRNIGLILHSKDWENDVDGSNDIAMV